MLYTKNSHLSNRWQQANKNTNIFFKEHRPNYVLMTPSCPIILRLLKTKKVLGTRLITNKISDLLFNKNPCFQISLKNAQGKKTNVEK